MKLIYKRIEMEKRNRNEELLSSNITAICIFYYFFWRVGLNAALDLCDNATESLNLRI